MSENVVNFFWYDYVIFVTMLAISVLIGIYFAFVGKKKVTASEYLMGSKKMKVVPVAISLVASHISGVTLLAVPADIYFYGAGYSLSIISMVIVLFVTTYIYMPVLFNLQITSTYEYLGRRFDQKTRTFSSFLYTLSEFFFLPIVVYIPALAFSAATGINLHLITLLVCGICIFYTTIGGVKAVVWTDTIQFSVTLIAIVTIMTIGIDSSTGGFKEIWQKAFEGDRLNIFDFTLDFTKRDHFWAYIFGFTTYWIALTNTNQGCVAKFLSVPTLRQANIVMVLYTGGLILVKMAAILCGMLIYAKYANCDPLTTKQISKRDQLFPCYVMDIAGHIPGISGLFIAGVFNTALSTLSAHLNCLSGTIYEDFISRWMAHDITEQRKSNILKLIVVVCGIVSTLSVFICERMGGILPLTIAFQAISAGPLLGMFTMGILSRKVNSKGAFYGGVFGLLTLIALAVPTQLFKYMKLFTYPPKPLMTDNCTYQFNATTTLFNQTINGHKYYVPSIFKISHNYYTLIGCVFTMIVSLIISHFSITKDPPVHRDLLSPIVYRFLSNDEVVAKRASYFSVEKAALHLETMDDKKNEKVEVEDG